MRARTIVVVRAIRLIAATLLLSFTPLSAPAAGTLAKGTVLPRVMRSGFIFAQATIDAQVDECRRMALERQGESTALYDSSATTDKQQFDMWNEKTETLLAAAKKARVSIGKFGDPTVFDSVRRSPTQVATEILADVDATLRAVTQNLNVLESQRQATPNDPVLYCSYMFVWAHKNILRRLSRYATIHQLTLEALVRYFRVRIRVASSISKAKYDKDQAEINDTLLDLYEHERQSSEHTRFMLKQLLKQ